MKRKWLVYAISLVIVLALYFITARMGLRLNAVSNFATLVWAPSGIALAALLILGYRYWPAITVAAFLINVITGAKPIVALGIATGNTLEPLLGAYLLNRVVKFQPQMKRVKDVIGLVFFAAILSTSVSATIGVTSLWLDKTVLSGAYAKTWFAWWIGDMLGVLVVAPLLLVWSRQHRKMLRFSRIAELGTCFVLLVCIGAIVFRGYPSSNISPFTLSYFVFPVMVWVALRFGQVGSVTSTFITSLVAILVVVIDYRKSSVLLTHQLLLLQGFMGIIAITFMIVAAVVAESLETQKLKERFAQRAKSLAQQRLRLLSLNQAKDDFISLASHQLRTPATSVKQYTSMLLDGYAGKLTKAQREFLETTYQSNENQLRIIDLLLKVAQVDAGKISLKKERVNLTLLINEILKAMDKSFANKNQVVNFEHEKGKLVAMIDKQNVRMVLENILDNASKYSPPGKSIDLKLEKNKNQIDISVKDSGVGIIQKDIKNIFKKYSRVKNPLSISVGGTGLGLYWAKKIIMLHKGSITVDSNPDSGSTFRIKIPVS